MKDLIRVMFRWLFRRENMCWPWQHDWNIKRGVVTPALSDRFSKGDLWRCNRCPAIKAK